MRAKAELGIGFDEDEPVLDRGEMFDWLDEVALAVNEDDSSVLLQIVIDESVKQRGLAAAGRCYAPHAGKAGFVGEDYGQLDLGEYLKGRLGKMSGEGENRLAFVIAFYLLAERFEEPAFLQFRMPVLGDDRFRSLFVIDECKRSPEARCSCCGLRLQRIRREELAKGQIRRDRSAQKHVEVVGIGNLALPFLQLLVVFAQGYLVHRFRLVWRLVEGFAA